MEFIDHYVTTGSCHCIHCNQLSSVVDFIVLLIIIRMVFDASLVVRRLVCLIRNERSRRAGNKAEKHSRRITDKPLVTQVVKTIIG